MIVDKLLTIATFILMFFFILLALTIINERRKNAGLTTQSGSLYKVTSPKFLPFFANMRFFGSTLKIDLVDTEKQFLQAGIYWPFAPLFFWISKIFLSLLGSSVMEIADKRVCKDRG